MKQGTIPFDESPLVVNKALEFIKDKVELVYPNAKFNEILNVAYFESQKMNVGGEFDGFTHSNKFI